MNRTGMEITRLVFSFLITMACFSVNLSGQTPLPAQTPLMIPHRLSLAQAEELLLQRNLTVIAAKYQIEANRAARLIASFRPNPTLTVGAEQFNLSNRLFKNIVRTDSNSAAATTYTIRYDQVIERGRKRELRTELAEQQLKASEAQMLDAVRTQLYQLHQAFTSAALARENLILAESTLEQYEQTIRLTAVKVENGDLAGVELYRAQAASIQYQQAVQQARTNYQQAVRDILNLLGAKVEDIQRPQTTDKVSVSTPISMLAPAGGPLVFSAAYQPDSKARLPIEAREKGITLPPSDLPLEIDFKFVDTPVLQLSEELKAIALAERPDVIAARSLYESAGRSLSLAQAQRVRDLSVGSFIQRIGSDQTVGVNVSIPLFVHNKGLAAISQAESLKMAAEALVRQSELQVVTDIEKAFLTYQAARRTLDIYNSTTMARAEKLRSIATISYREGATNLIELLDAQRTYNQTVNAFNQARADYQLALWQLDQAVGRPLR
jgi:outer membrane protein, heavy metal efflux system